MKSNEPSNDGHSWVKFEDNQILFNTKMTAKFFGVTPRTLIDWKKRGAPSEVRGWWNIKALNDWRGGSADLSDEARKLKADADYREHKARLVEMDRQVAEGKYIPVEQVTADLKRLFSNLRQSLLSIGHNIAIELNSIDQDAALVAKKIVDNVVYDALNELAKGKEVIQVKRAKSKER